MTGEFTCVLCPTSCVVSAEWNETELLRIDRAQCKLARDYVWGEIFDPRRALTSTVVVHGGDLPLVSVKADRPVPKGLVLDIVRRLSQVAAEAPIDVGDVLVPDVLGTGANIVATRKIEPTALGHRPVESTE